MERDVRSVSVSKSGMGSLPVVARLFVGLVVAAGVAALVAFLPQGPPPDAPLLALLVAASVLASVFKVDLPIGRGRSTLTIAYVVNIASLVLVGTGLTMLMAALGAWSQSTFPVTRRNPLHRKLFAMASLVLTVVASGTVYRLLGGPVGFAAGLQPIAVPLFAATAMYFVVNTITVATVSALSSGQSPSRVWYDGVLWSAPGYFVGTLAAMGGIGLLQFLGPVMAPVIVVPLCLLFSAFKAYVNRIQAERRRVEEVSHLHLETLEALASAIDAKDQLAPGHIRRVQHHATALAEACGMDEREVRGVQTAALLHDIGKIAVPDHILSKPGALSAAEFQKIRSHPKFGADIVAAVPFPYPVTPLILGHHERWDGNGYPAGLKGEDIPLGARILALVDFFDVVMTERPYHKAATLNDALALLREESGRGFDPALVDQFIELLPSLRAADAAETLVALERPIAPRPVPAKPRRPAAGSQDRVLKDIALAHREIYALYEMAQAMGSSLGIADTMTLIASKLESLVPYECCALFLFDRDSDTMACRFANGVDAATIRQIVLRRGDGLTGLVAKDGRTLLNGRPSADLEAAGLSGEPLTLQAALSCPLVLGDELIGVMGVYHTEDGFFNDDHRRLMERVSEQASAVIRNSLRFEQTQEDSLTDALTGLPNTRYLYMHLSQELARSQRQRSPVALIVIDLDDFKAINDTYGHHVGDRALREVAEALRRAIRPYDVCVRYAGDEFIVVLSNCGREEGEVKQQEIQGAIDAVYFEARAEKRLQIRASIGLAIFPADGEVYESLLATADRRMYGDKSRRKTFRPVAATPSVA